MYDVWFRALGNMGMWHSLLLCAWDSNQQTPCCEYKTNLSHWRCSCSSWNVYAGGVNETKILRTIDAMAALSQFGYVISLVSLCCAFILDSVGKCARYEYVNIDDNWMEPTRDANGNLQYLLILKWWLKGTAHNHCASFAGYEKINFHEVSSFWQTMLIVRGSSC